VTGRRQPDPEQPPFIIRKLRSRRAQHPHGAWKVAYADFVTSMMALFIVLWAAEQSPVIRSSIATYFRNPSALPSGREQSGLLPAGTGVVALPASGVVADSDEDALTEAAVRLRAALEAEADLRELKDQVRIEMTPEGLRVQLVERDDSLFFEIGSAQIKPTLTRLLGVVAQVVGALPNDVAVEGHTDTRQYDRPGRTYSNWELSADRANSARRVMEVGGLRQRQIVRVVGLADHDLLVPQDPLDAQNRRVSIIVRHRKPETTARGAGRDGLAQLRKLSARATEVHP